MKKVGYRGAQDDTDFRPDWRGEGDGSYAKGFAEDNRNRSVNFLLLPHLSRNYRSISNINTQNRLFVLSCFWQFDVGQDTQNGSFPRKNDGIFGVSRKILIK